MPSITDAGRRRDATPQPARTRQMIEICSMFFGTIIRPPVTTAAPPHTDRVKEGTMNAYRTVRIPVEATDGPEARAHLVDGHLAWTDSAFAAIVGMSCTTRT